MKTETIKIDKSEAWVDTMPKQPTLGGTLHVSLLISSNSHGRHYLKKRAPQGINPAVLQLEIVLSPEMIWVSNPQSLTYTEGVQSSSQYSSIDIFQRKKRLEVSKISKS